MRSAPNTMSGRRRRTSSQKLDRVGARMAALHALQREIVAGLERKMEMRHQPLLLGDRREQRGVDLDRIDRGEPASRGSSGTSLSTLRTSLPSVISPGRSAAIGGDVDAGQHDLGIAVRDERPHLRHHLARRHRARRSAAERDDAERAAMVAAVLDLHIGAGAVRRSRRSDGQRSRVTDMMSLTSTLSVSPQPKPLECRGFRLLLIADDVVDLVHGREMGGIDLRGAAGDHDLGVGVFTRRALRIACRAWRTASVVTAQVLTITAPFEPGGGRHAYA